MIARGKCIPASIVCILVVVCLALSGFVPIGAFYEEASLKDAINGILESRMSVQPDSDAVLISKLAENAGSPSSDWFAMAAARVGRVSDGDIYLDALEEYVSERYKKDDRLDAHKATEWHRIALTVFSLGGDPTAFGTDADGSEINLIADGVYYRGRTEPLNSQGINGLIWGLITLDAGHIQTPEDAYDTRNGIIEQIISAQCSDGGFSLDNGASNADITAMALQALAPYSEDGTVHASVERALIFLADMQKDDGDFYAFGECNAETTAQVIIALCTLGIDPDSDERFVKNGNSAVDGLMKYQTADGEFAHSKVREKKLSADSMATYQSLLALCALYRYRNGLCSLYDMRDACTNIFEAEEYSLSLGFTDEDLKEYESLPSEVCGKDYWSIKRLYSKLLRADNRDEYSDVIEPLKAKFEAVEAIRTQVNEINGEIEKLYPFDSLDREGEKTVELLADRAGRLSEYDQSQIPCLEQLLEAKAKIDSKCRSLWLRILIAVLLIATVSGAALMFIIRKRKRINGENSDW